VSSAPISTGIFGNDHQPVDAAEVRLRQFYPACRTIIERLSGEGGCLRRSSARLVQGGEPSRPGTVALFRSARRGRVV